MQHKVTPRAAHGSADPDISFRLWDPAEFKHYLFVLAGISAGFCALFFGVAAGWEKALAGYTVPLLGIVWAWFYEGKNPYAVTVSRTGDVHFHRTWRSLSTPARDIVLVEGHRFADYRGNVEWWMGVRDRSGQVISVDYFDEARAFVAALLALNPQIEVRGEWPSIGFPEPVNRSPVT